MGVFWRNVYRHSLVSNKCGSFRGQTRTHSCVYQLINLKLCQQCPPWRALKKFVHSGYISILHCISLKREEIIYRSHILNRKPYIHFPIPRNILHAEFFVSHTVCWSLRRFWITTCQSIKLGPYNLRFCKGGSRFTGHILWTAKNYKITFWWQLQIHGRFRCR